MLAKASELSKQLESYRETVAQKKKVIEFSNCYSCKAPLVFEHTIDASRQFVVESCECTGCGGKAEPRRYRVQ